MINIYINVYENIKNISKAFLLIENGNHLFNYKIVKKYNNSCLTELLRFY